MDIKTSVSAMKEAQTKKKTSAMPRILAGKPTSISDPGRKQRIQQYEVAVRLMRDGKYEKAKAALETLLSTGAGDLLDRARVHMTACQRQLEKNQISFNSPEEQYDYAISLLNTGYYEDAREQFQAILKKHASADYAHYGMAVMHSLTSRAEDCLEELARAIELNPRNRIQARLDSDFQEMFDDPRFTELLYPEIAS
jgi:outer membrane protein assembly factor BamD (BamD/ComL family)